jgi:hypothetical protein
MRAGEEFEDQQVRRMETGHGDVIQVFIAFGDVAADQDAQLLHGDSQFHSCFVFRVLGLTGFHGGRYLVHDPNGILRGKYPRPNQVENLDETLVHLTDLSTMADLQAWGVTLETGADSCLIKTRLYFVRQLKS